MLKGCLLRGISSLTKEGETIMGQREERMRRGGESRRGGRKSSQGRGEEGLCVCGGGIHALVCREHSRGLEGSGFRCGHHWSLIPGPLALHWIPALETIVCLLIGSSWDAKAFATYIVSRASFFLRLLFFLLNAASKFVAARKTASLPRKAWAFPALGFHPTKWSSRSRRPETLSGHVVYQWPGKGSWAFDPSVQINVASECLKEPWGLTYPQPFLPGWTHRSPSVVISGEHLNRKGEACCKKKKKKFLWIDVSSTAARNTGSHKACSGTPASTHHFQSRKVKAIGRNSYSVKAQRLRRGKMHQSGHGSWPSGLDFVSYTLKI